MNVLEMMIELNIIPEPKSIVCTDEDAYLEVKREKMSSLNGLHTKISLGYYPKTIEMQHLGELFKHEFDFFTDFSIELQQMGSANDNALITIVLDKSVPKNKYSISIEDRVQVMGGSLQALHWATVSLLQMLPWDCATRERLRFHKCRIEDQLEFEYIGLLVDLARHWHPISVVKQCVLLCRWYKIPFLHLHFADDQSFTLPLQAYPKIPTKKRHYSHEEIRDLERYAYERGVTIIPEIDWPGHSKAMVSAYPKLFGVRLSIFGKPRANTVNLGKTDIIERLASIVKEISDLFPRSPYFHIGADEVNYDAYKDDKDINEALSRHGFQDVEELYRDFIVRMNEVVKKNGKQMCVWEGFRSRGIIEIPKDLLVFVFESLYNTADQLINDGYNVVNTSWQPIYITRRKNWTVEQIYGWNPNRWENWNEHSIAYNNPIEVPYSNQLKGAQMCAWELIAEEEIPLIRQRLAAFIEKTWNHEIKLPFSNFQLKLDQQDKKLNRFLET